MSQTKKTDKAHVSEGRSRETGSFVRRVKSITRRKDTRKRSAPHHAGGVSAGGDGERAVPYGELKQLVGQLSLEALRLKNGHPDTP